jgi:glyoxylase I family protein
MQCHPEHLGLAAQNSSTLKDWYVNVFGARVVFDNGASPPAFLLKLPGGLIIEIYPAARAVPETADNSVGGWRHLALRVGSIEEAKAELELRGVSFTEAIKPAGGGGRVLFFRDAEGNVLHLVERPAGWRLEAID